MINPHRYVVSYHTDSAMDDPVDAAREVAGILGLEEGVFVVRDKISGSMVEVTLADECDGADPVVVPGGCRDCCGPAPTA